MRPADDARDRGGDGDRAVHARALSAGVFGTGEYFSPRARATPRSVTGMNVKLSPDAAQRLTRLAIEQRRTAQEQAAYLLERQLKRTAPRTEIHTIEAREPERTT